jgi:glutathione S-transferase
MITLYHLLESRSERVIWLLEELGAPYALQAFRREANMEAPAAYRAIHPMGTSPILRDADITLVETGAIVEYILERQGGARLRPTPGTPDHALYLQWMHFAEGSAAFSYLTEAMLELAAKSDAGPPRARGLRKLWRDRNDRTLPYLNDELGKRAYFAGEAFTAADIMMTYSFGIFERFLGRPLEPYPAVVRYLAKVRARPAYLRAEEIARREPRPTPVG